MAARVEASTRNAALLLNDGIHGVTGWARLGAGHLQRTDAGVEAIPAGWNPAGDGDHNDTLEVAWSDEPGRQPGIPLYGWDEDGAYIEFDADDVVTIPVPSSDGRVCGAGFPLSERDAEVITSWGSTENRRGNREFRAAWPVTDVATREEAVAPGWYRDSPPIEAPYFDPDHEPLVLFAHANNNGYTVAVRDKQTGRQGEVLVDGIVLGRLAEGNEYFSTAVEEHSGSSLLQLSCRAAKPGGDAHRLLANYLHENGFTGDVWAGRDVMFVHGTGQVAIRIEVTPDGTMAPPFEVTRAPSNRPATDPDAA